jgi:hypothetical protein
MPNENGDKWKGIRKMIIGLVVYLGGLYLEVTEGTGKPWMWLGAGISAGGNVWDYVVSHLKIGNK